MSTYRGQSDRPAQARAIAAVAVVHAALAAVILSGLNVRMVEQAVDRLSTFNVREPPPPPLPPPPPPPKPNPQQAKQPEGAPAPKAKASPIVAPKPVTPVPSPIVAAKVAGTGSASTQGAASAGTGTGAGGSGTGTGGGGVADYSRFTPARIIRNLTNRDYRQLAAGRLPAGGAIVALRVEPTGVATGCRLVRSSGDPIVDGGLCPLIAQRLRFRPALDDRGRPIPYSLQYVATWRL